MNASLLLAALGARYRLFLLVLAVTVAATVAVSLIVPKTYVARVSVLLDGPDEQSLRNPAAPPERERTGYMQTQVDILSSPKVAHRVISDLKLANDPDIRAQFEAQGGIGNISDWLAEGLLKQLKVDTSQSSVVQLIYSSPDAQLSARVANAFAQAYVDTVLELRVAPTRQTSAWFDDQLKGLRQAMEEAEQRLARFQREHGIVATDERYDVENIQLSELASQVVRARDPGSGTWARGGADPEGILDSVSAPGIQELKANLLRAEARLQELSAELGPRHPQYLRQSAEVEALRKRIESETRSAVAASTRLAQQGRQRRDRLLSELAAHREKALQQAEARSEMAVLAHDVSLAQRTYDTAMQRFMASTIESRAVQTNVSILDPAVPPAKPARPKLFLNVALSVVVGTLLGMAAVYLQEMFDQRVRVLEDLASDPQVPVLAVLENWNPATQRLPAYPGSWPALPGPG